MLDIDAIHKKESVDKIKNRPVKTESERNLLERIETLESALDEIRDICHGQYVKSAAINTIKGLCDYALDDIIAKAYRMRE